MVGIGAVTMSPTTTATSRDDGCGCYDGGIGGMAATKSCVGGRHVFEATLVDCFEARLEVSPSLVCCDFVVPLFDGASEDACVLLDFLRGADESAVIDGIISCFSKSSNVSDTQPE